MRREILGKIAFDLLSVPPLIFRLIRRKLVTTLADTDVDIKLLHFEIMHFLKEKGTQHPAEIGDKLLIAKAQMTYLIDKLVELGLVQREIDPNDRRTLNISLTEKGRKFLDEQDNLVINAVRENMAILTDKELETLYDSLRNLRDILFKLQ
ncbi:MAG: MarR family transcriptional regulator [Dehalococcoidales bacterium]|nr:MarR family transcriptional regulator [Dehalococcoidales bacterium]